MRHTIHDQSDDDGRVRIDLHFDHDDLRLVDTPFGVEVHLVGMEAGGDPGAPALPRTRVRIAVPEPFWPHRLAIDAAEYVALTDEPALVIPAQRLRPGMAKKHDERQHDKQGDGEQWHEHCDCCARREWYPRVSEPFPAPGFTPPDIAKYEAAAKDPQPPAVAVDIETAGRTHVAVVEIMPMRLNADGRLELCTTLELSVSYGATAPIADRDAAIEALQAHLGRDIDPARVDVRPEPVIRSLDEARRIRKILLTQVLNPDLLAEVDRQWPFYELPCDYLIVTDDRQWDAAAIQPGTAVPGMADAFRRLAKWKRSRGVSARVVTISDIVAGYFGDHRTGARDLQEVIRRFLRHAKDSWGVSWLLLGGDVSVVPVRTVAGAYEGNVSVGAKAVPDEKMSYWTGSYMKVHANNLGTWWGASSTNQLVRSDTGALIPYDLMGTSSATSTGWYFTTSDTYATRSATATEWVRVNGPAAIVNGPLQFLYMWNTIPTDFYYASLDSWVWVQERVDFGWFSFTVPQVYFPPHAWDALDNGVYGQHTPAGTDFDGVIPKADLSVGRAPVETATEATTFVDKVIAYERFGSGVFLPVDGDWPRRMLLASSDWSPEVTFAPTSNDPPGAGHYHHDAGNNRSVLAMDVPPDRLAWDLVAEISAADRRILPYKSDTNPAVPGWYFATSNTDLSVAEIHITLPWFTMDMPWPSKWIVVHGPVVERTPSQFTLDWFDPDGSMTDQELVRQQVGAELPGIDTFDRLYEDDLDLTPPQRWAAPVQHLTSSRLEAAMNARPHIVSLSGHGSGDGCCGGSKSLASSLTNGTPGFIAYADSCLTNQFDDNDDSFSERLLTNPDGGAVAYVGNTRFSWIGVGDNYQRAFFHRLTATRHLGMLNDSKCSVYGTGGFQVGYDRWVIMALNLLGDPEMRVHRHAVAGLNSRVKEPKWWKPIEVYVEQAQRPPHPPEPAPMSDVLVVFGQGDLVVSRRTEADGIAHVDANVFGPGPLEVTVSNEDSVHQQVVELAEQEWVIGRVAEVSHHDRGSSDTVVRIRVHYEPDSDSGVRDLVVMATNPDLRVILDAVENVLLSGKEIALMVEHDDGVDVITRFRMTGDT